MRDDFALKVKRVLAERVANHCSRQKCRAITSGPRTEPGRAVNLGVAAHITAASAGGPRYDPALSPPQRQDVENGIWLCQNCAKLVDSDPSAFPSELLRDWKVKAEEYARINIGKTASRGRSRRAPEPNLEIVFDPACEACFDESGRHVCLGVWNNGLTADDVHVYLASVIHGPILGKLELLWLGEGLVGRSINMSIPAGHHHVRFLESDGSGPYTLVAGAPVGALPVDRTYVAEVLVEGRNIPPVLARVDVDPREEPPVRKVTSLS